MRSAAEQADQAMRDGTITQEQYDGLQREITETGAKLKSLEEQVKESATALQEIAAKGEKLKTVGENITDAGKKFLPVTGVVARLGTAAVKIAADFDSAMSKVAAVSDAAASGEDLATTSDIVTDALTAFGLTAAGSGHFADILAAASSNANTNVSMMGENFKYCAPIAGALGFSAEDTAEAIGMDGGDGYWYGFSNQGNSSGDATMLWIKIKQSDYTFMEGSWTLSNATLMVVGSFRERSSYPSGVRNAVVRNGYLYVPSYDKTGVYKINISYSTDCCLSIINDIIVAYDFQIDVNDNVLATYVGEHCDNVSTPFFRYKEYVFAWGGVYLNQYRYTWLLTPYLATISNLSQYVCGYTDPNGERRYIYSKDLAKLREREKKLVKDQLDGLDVYVAGVINCKRLLNQNKYKRATA